MPANSGAIAGTVAHRHSVPSGDGGQLSEGVTNFTGGLVNEVLTNNGTDIPVWAAIPSAAGAWAEQGNDIQNSFVTSLSVDVGDADVYQILYHVCDNGGLANCSIRINDVALDSYKTLTSFGTTTSGNMDVNASAYATTLDNKWLLSSQKQDAGYSGIVYIYKYNSNFNLGAEAGHTFTSEGSSQQGTGAPTTAHPQLISVCSGCAESITANITNIKVQMILEGTTTVRTIMGSMRVNSLSY